MTELEDLLTDMGVNLDVTGIKKTQYRSIDKQGDIAFEINVQPLSNNNVKIVVITVYSRRGRGKFDRNSEYVFSVNRAQAPTFQRTVVRERTDNLSRDRRANAGNRSEIQDNLESFAALQRVKNITMTEVETRGIITAYGT